MPEDTPSTGWPRTTPRPSGRTLPARHQPPGQVQRRRGPPRPHPAAHHRRPRQAPLPGLRRPGPAGVGAHPPRPFRQGHLRTRPGAAAHGHRAAAPDRLHRVRRSARPHHLRPDHGAREAGGTRPARPGPAPARRRPRARLAQDQPQPYDRRGAAHGPEGRRGRRQRLPGRGAVPARHRPLPGRQGPHPRRVGRDLGRPGRADARGRPEQPHRHRPPRTHPEAMGRPPRVDDHGGEVYVYRRANLPCHICGGEIRTAGLAARNLFWCPGCQRA